MSTQGIVWIIPDFGASALFLEDGAGGSRKIWVNVSTLGTARRQSPVHTLLRWGNAPVGSRVVAGDPLGESGFGYGSLARALRRLFSTDWIVKPWGYEWRDSVYRLGRQLATEIEANGSPVNKLIAHGYGALVAQAAARYLADDGRSNLLTTVVTLGAIFSGTYSVCSTWLGNSDPINVIAGLNDVEAAFEDNLLADIVSQFNSWPAVYDMLPDPTALDDPGDVSRAALIWDTTKWATALAPPDQGLMSFSQVTVQPWLHSGQSAIDPAKWTCVAAIDPARRTGYRIAPHEQVGGAMHALSYQQPAGAYTSRKNALAANLPIIQTTTQGDGRATLASQTRPGVPQVLVRGGHVNLPTHPDVIAALPGLLGITADKPTLLRVLGTLTWP